jgi:predicted amidohydrolase
MPRIVRIATIAQGDWGGPTVEANRRRMAGLIELALADRPDIIALPESFTLADLAEPRIEEMAEDVPGLTLEMVGAYARENRVYILCPILARRADGLHIEAFLLDRAGKIAGSYQKNHPVVEGCGFTKLEFGSLPGSTAPVFETDFGKIGVQICFDIEYRDGWDELERAGAEIIFWLSAYDGGRDLNAKAWAYHRPVASAVHSRHARVIDCMGETLSITGDHEAIAFASIDLDTALFHMDFNKSQIPAIRQKYGADVRLRLYHEESIFTLQSNAAGLTVAEIIQEFQLDPLKDYLERNRRLQDALREGSTIPELKPPYQERSQWV